MYRRGEIMADQKIRTVDPAAAEMLELAQAENIITAWDRYKAQQPQCKFGYTGVCCRICIQGPCRIIPSKAGADRGICGATAYTIVARNLIRFIAGGASAHSDHGREIARTVLAVAEGHAPDYKISDPEKLIRVAEKIGVETAGREINAIAKEVAIEALKDFGRYEDEPCTWIKSTVPEGRMKKFKDTNIIPYAIDRSITKLMHSTHMGVDNDPVNLIFTGLQTALVDYDGMALATDLTDSLFGTPHPIVSEANLAVIDADYVNIAVHGHNPLLSQMVVYASREMNEKAKALGAKGINIVGICCTGNEVLMREGVKKATNFASQELAIMTGALEAMVVDVQCIMPGVKTVAECFHTQIVTTSAIAKIPGAQHIPFNEATAMEDARKVIEIALEAFKNRNPEKVKIPKYKNTVIAGFSVESLLDVMASTNPENPVSVITDAIKSGELRGVCLFAGCNNLRGIQDEGHMIIAKELAKNNVLLLATGCAAGAYSKLGLMSPDAVEIYAGDGLKSFLKRVNEKAKLTTGLPLIFHMGSCVDNSRAAELYFRMANELGVDVPKVPFVASAPEAMSEKAISIGAWNVAMGIPVHVGTMPPIEGSELVLGITTQIARDVFGGYFIFELDPVKAAQKLLAALDERTWKLKIHTATAEKYSSPLYQGYDAQ